MCLYSEPTQKGYEVLAFSSPHNARLRVLNYRVTDYAGMKSALASYAAHHHLGKIFIKAREEDETDLKKVGFSREATIDDITAMTALFTETFTTYPFPVYDANFLNSSMSQGNIYQLVMDGDTIAAMAGAEINFPQRCAELTDFATRGQYRGNPIGHERG